MDLPRSHREPAERAALHAASVKRHPRCSLPKDRPAQNPDRRVLAMDAIELAQYDRDRSAARRQACAAQRQIEIKNEWPRHRINIDAGDPIEPYSAIDERLIAKLDSKLIGMGKPKRRIVPFVEKECAPKTPPKPIATLRRSFKRSEQWALQLVYDLMIGTVPKIDALPSRITRDVLAFVLAVTAPGHPGPHQKSITTTARILLSDDQTKDEIAAWKSRTEKAKPRFKIGKKVLDFFPGVLGPRQPKAPYEIPSAAVIAYSLQSQRLQLAA